FWLLLLNPMPGAIEEMESDHMCACGVAHLVDRARRLVDAPVAFACDELRGQVDGTTRESVHLRNASGIRAAPHTVALQRAGEPGPSIFGRVHLDLGLGQPFAVRDVIRRR